MAVERLEVHKLRITHIQIVNDSARLEARLLKQGLHRLVRLICGSEQLRGDTVLREVGQQRTANAAPPGIAADIQHIDPAVVVELIR